MSDYKDLTDKEGIDKLKELVKSIDVCMFASKLTSLPISARPMSTRGIDDDGTIWFFSQASADVNQEIQHDNRVQLFYGKSSSSEYLNISGYATISKDEQKAKALWSTWAKTWFPEGPSDPELMLISIEPDHVHYWDTKHNKMTSLLKIAAGALTGKTMDDGVEGEIAI